MNTSTSPSEAEVPTDLTCSECHCRTAMEADPSILFMGHRPLEGGDISMWVWTQDNELVNFDHVEFVRVEQDDDDRDFELRAYPFQMVESEEDVFYTLAARQTPTAAQSLLEEVVGALSGGTDVLDLRRHP